MRTRIHSHCLTALSRISGPDSQEGPVPPTGLYPHAVWTQRPSWLRKLLSFTPNIQPERTPTLLLSPP